VLWEKGLGKGRDSYLIANCQVFQQISFLPEIRREQLILQSKLLDLRIEEGHVAIMTWLPSLRASGLRALGHVIRRVPNLSLRVRRQPMVVASTFGEPRRSQFAPCFLQQCAR
jgi:hypothetical protein